MFKKIIILTIFITSHALANESLLTFQQQLERLQREINDISKIVFKDQKNYEKLFDDNLSKNLSAIDIRIYDLENDIKSITASIEELSFSLDDINNLINSIQETINLNNNNLNITGEVNEVDGNNNTDSFNIETDVKNNDNTLGTLTISSNDSNNENIELSNQDKLNVEVEENLSPEDQFQKAFDNIRYKKYDEAEVSLQKFIENNPKNQLSGSAHYWLGELYILKSQYREAALILAEGFQLYPESIKAPDMLFKLSNTLFELNKNEEACKTAEKFILDFPNHKSIKKTNKLILDRKCFEQNE
ncbi:tol-pal system protein YbgF [Pelagibacteraceae bacterium]|nr:tol-pal system protein YbgF [Pelagibacteraceae bacterium]